MPHGEDEFGVIKEIFLARSTDREIDEMGQDDNLVKNSRDWMSQVNPFEYSYHFTWMGRPIIQYPQDMIAMQEILWKVKPDLVIETGIAHGGSLAMSASMLAMLDYCETADRGGTLDPKASKRQVLGIDIDIRPHNREAIKAHPMSHLIKMIEGSSVDPDVVGQVKAIAKNYNKILIFLDSNHTHEHVLREMQLYSPFVTCGSYLVVFDTIVEDMPKGSFTDRPWGVGNNPKTAVWEFLKNNDEFEIDKEIENKLLITVAPDGYLKRIR